MVRTSGFHPGNRGSIPLGATKRSTRECWSLLLLGSVVSEWVLPPITYVVTVFSEAHGAVKSFPYYGCADFRHDSRILFARKSMLEGFEFQRFFTYNDFECLDVGVLVGSCGRSL